MSVRSTQTAARKLSHTRGGVRVSDELTAWQGAKRDTCAHAYYVYAHSDVAVKVVDAHSDVAANVCMLSSQSDSAVNVVGTRIAIRCY